MSLIVSLNELERQPRAFRGNLGVRELEMEDLDEVIQVSGPLKYDLWAGLEGESLWLEGELRQRFDFRCVRCLKPFGREVVLSNWSAVMALRGPEGVALDHERADLTQRLREDMLLVLPPHPLCRDDCGGLEQTAFESAADSQGPSSKDHADSMWSALDRLKLG